MGAEGAEPPPELPEDSRGKTQVPQLRDAPDDALDPELAKIIATWPSLPETTRQAILALIR
jgi:hypothetical protein